MGKKKNQTDNEDALKKLVEDHGIHVLFSSWLNKHGYSTLYNRFVHNGGKLEEIAFKLNLQESYLDTKKKISDGRHKVKWTEDTLKFAIDKVVKEYGFLPPATFLNRDNGLQGLGGAIQKFGGHKVIKEKYKIGDRLRLFDKLGQIYNSFPEASLANYLLSKGVKPIKGQRYPDAYAKMSGMNYGIFDMHFVATAGHLQNKMLNIEIFGDNPGGRGAEEYAKVRSFKEKFNENDECFVSVEHLECYKIKKLDDIFGKHIAPADSLIENDSAVTDIFDATMLSLADEVMVRLKRVCEKMPDGLLPSSGWFLRIDCHKNRPIENWEDSTWKGLMDNVSDCGGILKFRKALGQTLYSGQKQLSREDTIEKLKEFYENHHQTPKAYTHRDKDNLTEQEKSVWKLANEITNAANANFESMRHACTAANIPMQRYRIYDTGEAVISAMKKFYFDNKSRSPRSIEKELLNIKMKDEQQKNLLNDARNLKRAGKKFFESYGKAWQNATQNLSTDKT